MLSSRRSSPAGSRSLGGPAAGQRAGRKPTIRSFVTDDNHLLYHLWVFVCGLTLVVPLCVGIIQRFPLSFQYEPPGLGIVSVTTLSGFPVQQEFYYYVLALLVLMLGPGVLWLTWLVFSLSLARVLGRDFGTVATRGCWAWLLFPLVFPYALLRPEVTFALLVPSAVAVPLAQVFLVLALPQTVDRELKGAPSLSGWAPVLRFVERWRPLTVVRRSSRLVYFLVLAVVVSWALFLALAGRGEGAGGAVTLMVLLTLSLPVLFLVEWVVLNHRLAQARARATGAQGALGVLLMDFAGIAVAGYLYFVVRHPEVMLAAVAILAVLLVKELVVGRLGRGAKAARLCAHAAVGLGLFVAFALVTCEPSFLRTPPGLNPEFLQEDGAHLAWANAILHGDVQGRDFYSMYGPLLHYGLVGMMKVVGVRAEAAPLYWWLGRIAGALAASLLLWELTGNGLYAVLGLLVLHTGVGWRTAFALAALAAFTHCGRTRRVRWAVLAGLFVGVALACSQELGLCALLGCLAGTAVLAWRYETRRFAGEAFGLLLVGGALALGPLALRFFLSGALGNVLRDLAAHPRYVLMGYGNLRFPALFPALAEGRPIWGLVREMVAGTYPLAVYFPIMVWVVTLQLVGLRYVLGKATPRDLGALMMMVFGVFAFRVVLARSDVVHLHLVMPVALVLFLWQFWLLVGRVEAALTRASFRVVNVGEFAALSLVTIFLFDAVTLRGDRVAVVWGECREACQAVAQLPRFLVGPSQLERAVVPPATSSVVADVVHYVQAETAPAMPILAVPNIPVFYFLTDRPNPVRFAQMAQLVTSGHRVEAHQELQRRPPALVLFHGGDNDIDNIPPTRQFPNVLSLILGGYERAAKFGPIYVLRPRREPAPPAPRLVWQGAKELARWQASGDGKRVGTDQAGTLVVSPGNQSLTLAATLEDIAGGAYRSLRFSLVTQTGGNLSVGWRTREPLDAQEQPQAAVALSLIGARTQVVELDLRDYPSWLFSHVRELSVTVAPPLQVTVESVELVPAGNGPQESGATLSPGDSASGRAR